jgi:hypothetical protein
MLIIVSRMPSQMEQVQLAAVRPAFVHVLENLAAPAGDDQAVDDDGGFV